MRLGNVEPGFDMNWNPFKKKDEKAELDPLRDLTLSALRPGYVVDYDLKTWQVTAQHHYDFEGDRADEWELTCADGVRFLDREEDDGIRWTLTRKIQLSAIEGNLRGHLKESEDPPDTVVYEGTEYFGESSDGGEYFKDGEEPGQEFIVWSYADESGKKVLYIEQWGDDEYEAAVGEVVEEYQFSDILPGGST